MCHSLKKKRKGTLNMAAVIDNKKLWKLVKPLFLNKVKARDNIKLIEDGVTITNELELTSTFNNYLSILYKAFV